MLAAAGGELTQLGIRYKHGDIRSNRPAHEPLLPSYGENDNLPTSLAKRRSLQDSSEASPDWESRPGMDGQPQRTASMTANTMNILDKVPKGYTSPLTGSHSSRYGTASTSAGGRPRTTGSRTSGRRPLHEPFLGDTASTASPSGRPDVPRSRSANHAGRTGRDERNGRLAASDDENDMVGRWDYASSEDHVSAATASGLFHPAAATGYSVGIASHSSSSSVCDIDNRQASGCLPL